MAPRLRPAGAPADRQGREREVRRLKRQLADLERQIGEKEQAVRDLEHLMSSPELYADRVQADKVAADHKAMTADVARLLAEWESLQGEADLS